MQFTSVAEKVDTSKLLAMNAMHQATSERLVSSYQGLQSRVDQVKPGMQASAHMAFVQGMLGSAFVKAPVGMSEASVRSQFNLMAADRSLADIEAEMSHVMEKVMALVALVVNEFQSEIAGMEDIMAILKSLDGSFFEGSGAVLDEEVLRAFVGQCLSMKAAH